MSTPIRAGEDDEPFRSLGWLETVVLLFVLGMAAVSIGAMTAIAWLFRVLMPDNAPYIGPYRQVR